MKKNKAELYKGILDSYVEKEKEEENKPEEVAAPQAATTKSAPKKGKPQQKKELTGEALEESLTPEVQKLIQLRRGRPRLKTLQEEGVVVRTSFILRALQIEKLRQIAFLENVTLKEVVEEAFKNAIETYEQRNGALTITSRKGSAQGLFTTE